MKLKTISFEGLLSIIPLGVNTRRALHVLFGKEVEEHSAYEIKKICWSSFWEFQGLIVSALINQFSEKRGYFDPTIYKFTDETPPNFKTIALGLFNQYLDGFITYPKLTEGIANTAVLNLLLKTETELSQSSLDFVPTVVYCFRCNSTNTTAKCTICKKPIDLDWEYCYLRTGETRIGEKYYYVQASNPLSFHYDCGEMFFADDIASEKIVKEKVLQNIMADGWTAVNSSQDNPVFKRRYNIGMIWMTCEIELFLINKHFFSNEYEFIAESDWTRHDSTKKDVGKSIVFSTSKVNLDKNKIDENTRKSFNSLFQELTGNGWKSTGHGKQWWNYRFQKYLELENVYKILRSR